MVDPVRFYEHRLRRYGNSPRTLGLSPESQRRRFQVLAEVGDLQRSEVLDVGCGLGHLYDFFDERSLRLSYRGADLSPKLIARARRLHPGVDFEVLDALGGSMLWEADFVLSSGVLNLETGSAGAAMSRLLRSAFAACRRATAVNMLSTWADWRDPGRHYFDPSRALRVARRLTPRVVMRHDYLPHDFTLYLYKERDQTERSRRSYR